MSLYLKYRPRKFDDMVGQDYIKITLSNATEQGRLSHAYLFSGPRGTGKTSMARLIAKALTCENDEMKKQADDGRMVDIIEIDAASNRGIDEIRDLREKIQFAPVMAKAKVYIIDEVHMLTKEAFNALLKTLEEPPSHAYFVLATTEIHKIPETILSRCQHFSFQRISNSAITKRLEFICQNEGITYEKEALELIAGNSQGGLRDAIASLEQMMSSSNITFEYVKESLGVVSSKVIELFSKELIDGNAKNALEIVQEIVYEGYDLSQLIKELLEFLREQMLNSVKEEYVPDRILKVIEVIQDASQKIKLSIIPQLPIEIVCIQLGLDLKSEEKEESSGGIFSAMRFGSSKEKDKKKDEKDINLLEVMPKKKEDKKEEEKKYFAVKEEIEFSLENVKNNWLTILENIETPVIRSATKSAEIMSVENDNLILAVSTDFYKNTLSNTHGNLEVKKALQKIFGKSIKIDIQKKEGVVLTPKSEEKKEENGDKGNSLVDMASEIFGH